MDQPFRLDWERGPGDVRCELPRRSNLAATIGGSFFIGIGLLIGCFPIAGSMFFAFVGPADRVVPRGVILMPLFFFGIFCFPIATALILKGIFLLWGRTEIVIDGDRLRAVTRFGPLWSTRRCDLEDLAGFRVEGDPGGGGSSGVTAGLASLVAVRKQKRPLHLARAYRKEIIDQLAEDLGAQIKSVAAIHGKPGLQQPQVENVSLDPRSIHRRDRQPIDSDAVVEQRRNDCVIRFPAKGWRQSPGLFTKLFCYLWVGAAILFTAILLPALIPGQVQGDARVGWVLLPMLWMVAIGAILVQLHKARRCGMIQFTEETLRFEETGIFGVNRAVWNRAAIDDVVVAAKLHETDDSSYWEHYIEVRPDPNPERQWFSDRDKFELEWIATLLRDEVTAES